LADFQGIMLDKNGLSMLRIRFIIIYILYTAVYVTSLKNHHDGRKYSSIRRKLGMLDDAAIGISQCFSNFHQDYAQYAFTGAIAGGCRAISRGITFPFDTMKTLVQADIDVSDNTQLVARPSASIDGTAMKKSSVYNYFRGVIPTVVAAIPANALFFIVFNSLEKIELTWTACYNNGHLDSERLLVRLIISAIATLPQNVIKIPSELIKQRAQTQPTLTYADLIKQALDSGGIFGFYRGWEAQLLREIPYNAFQMATYASMRDFVADSKFGIVLAAIGIKSDGATISAVEGLIAATVAALLTQPADTMKTKMMTEGTVPSKVDGELISSTSIADVTSSTSFGDAARKIYEEDGLAGFFQGLKPRLYIVSFGGMIYFWASSLADTWFSQLR
jgi:hypothetical protein